MAKLPEKTRHETIKHALSMVFGMLGVFAMLGAVYWLFENHGPEYAIPVWFVAVVAMMYRDSRAPDPDRKK